MKKSIRSIMLGSGILLCLAMMFTSCEGEFDDLFGEWSRPTGNVNSGNEKPSGNIAVTSITLDETSLEKKLGDVAVTLTATVKPDDATDKTITWSSEDPAVASVSNGLVSILGEGTTIITATANDGSGVKATCTVTVKIPGLLAGKFTINASGDQVRFSQGNLQATTTNLGTSWTWAFAEHQWDYIGGRSDGGSEPETGNNYINGNGTVSDNGTVDLFGWVGASSTVLTTNPAMYGISNSTTASDYGIKKGPEGETLMSDWGKLAITNGGNTPNSGWRTLTSDEWVWLLGPVTRDPGTNCRASGANVNNIANACYTYATINTDGTAVKGMIIFPDGVTIASTEADAWGNINLPSDFLTSCSKDQWTALAAKGCVFLPAAGYRNSSKVNNAGTNGNYWSSSPYVDNFQFAHNVLFAFSNYAPANYTHRCFGRSVRLVYDVK